MNKYLETLGYIALFVGAAVACGKGKSSPSNDSPAPNSGPSEMAVTVEAATLMADYKGNEVRGDAKWKNKKVRVFGIVSDIKKDILDRPFITIGTGAAFEIPEVHCTLASGQEQNAATISKGAKVMMRGRVEGLSMNVQVSDCQLVPAAEAAQAIAGLKQQTAPSPQQPAPQPQPQPHPATPAKAPPRRR